jgi:hypothetical protein
MMAYARAASLWPSTALPTCSRAIMEARTAVAGWVMCDGWMECYTTGAEYADHVTFFAESNPVGNSSFFGS